jgi:hypothetical protein
MEDNITPLVWTHVSPMDHTCHSLTPLFFTALSSSSDLSRARSVGRRPGSLAGELHRGRTPPGAGGLCRARASASHRRAPSRASSAAGGLCQVRAPSHASSGRGREPSRRLCSSAGAASGRQHEQRDERREGDGKETERRNRSGAAPSLKIQRTEPIRI